MPLTAAVDGSALGNPGPAGWAWYIDADRWAAGGWPRATNNQGELQAVLELLSATLGRTDELHILCDSQYVINSVTKWMPGWKRKGWKKGDGKPVLNREQLEAIDALLAETRESGTDVTFEWVKGHANHEMNEAADTRARGAATAYQSGTAVPSGPGLDGDPLDDLEEAETLRDDAGTVAEHPGATTVRSTRTPAAAGVTVTCTLESAEAAAIVAAAERSGRHPQEELASLIRLGMTHSYGK